MTEFELEQMKFHWEVWKGESKAFWGRAILGTAVLLLSIFFQWGVIPIPIPGFTLNRAATSGWFYAFVNILSWFLLGFLCFKFVDLMRHRVPEWMEEKLHNNLLIIAGLEMPLTLFGRLLYLVFPLYVLLFAIVLLLLAIGLNSGSLPLPPK